MCDPEEKCIAMVLNYIWIAFFLIAFVVASVQLAMGNTEVFPAIVGSTFDSARTAFEISLGLTGVLSLWMGIMKIGEQGGIVGRLARLLSPLMVRLFPEVPAGHPVFGHIFMNFSANMLGLDNAATPLGLKAMEGLQQLNPRKDTASNAMIMFLVLNTSGLTLIPVGVMVYRAQMGAAQPTDVFIPILIATTVATLAGMVISRTGTGFVHSTGYMLTYHHGLPHGQANAYFLPDFVRCMAEAAPERAARVYALCGVADADGLAALLGACDDMKLDLHLSDDLCVQYADKTAGAKNVANAVRVITRDELLAILRSRLG